MKPLKLLRPTDLLALPPVGPSGPVYGDNLLTGIWANFGTDVTKSVVPGSNDPFLSVYAPTFGQYSAPMLGVSSNVFDCESSSSSDGIWLRSLDQSSAKTYNVKFYVSSLTGTTFKLRVYYDSTLVDVYFINNTGLHSFNFNYPGIGGDGKLYLLSSGIGNLIMDCNVSDFLIREVL